jgi:hypothetical protein
MISFRALPVRLPCSLILVLSLANKQLPPASSARQRVCSLFTKESTGKMKARQGSDRVARDELHHAMYRKGGAPLH